MQSRARGRFSRVEGIAVAVILGLLAAVAVPRLQEGDAETRVAAVKRMGGALKSAANRAHSVCMAKACANESVIVIDGQAVAFVNGYPTGATIGKLVRGVEGFAPNATGETFARKDSRTDECWVRYTQAADGGQAPTISYQSGTITNAASETLVNNALRQQC
jgi:type II secretory pathway pseudopilin PulG